MKKLIVHLMTGYCGEDAYEALGLPDDCSNEEIDDICWEMAIQNAESYGHCEEDDEAFLERIDYSWQDYEPEKHDGYSMTGSFEEDFERYN